MSESGLLDKLLTELEALDAPTELDLMLSDHPGKKITRNHLARARSAAERWLLIAWRFPWLYKSREEQAGQAPQTLEDIQKLQKNLLPAGEAELIADPRLPTPDLLELDLTKLRAIPRPELTKANGTVNVSEIARRLGYSTGGGKWDHIKEVAAHLQAEYDEQDQLAGWDDEVEPDATKQEAA